MKIESDNGDNFHLKLDSPISIGRSHVNDKTVSRHHISLELLNSINQNSNESTRVSLKATGRNPVWVRNGNNGEIRVYRKGERAELRSGDGFSISGKKHAWFRLRSEVEIGGKDENEAIGDVSDMELEAVDTVRVDPFKEFGFVTMGHEFDSYTKRTIHNMNKWNWFLEEPKKGSEDDDDNDVEHRRNSGRRKRKKGIHDGQGDDDDDDEWECEFEEDKELVSNTKKIRKLAYSTRSKGGKSTKFGCIGKGKSKTQESRKVSEEETGDGDDDENDETLGGFIVENEDDIEDEIRVADEEDDNEEDEFEEEDEDLG